MKTILVPTDFSDAARNAINYAAEIAKLTHAKLILFHVYHLPVVVAEAPIVIPVDEIEKDSMRDLQGIKTSLAIRHGEQLQVECECRLGFAMDEILTYSAECRPDMIVMGMQGAGFLTEKIIGSITSSLIKRSKCPVLAIDSHVEFKSIKKMVLACDYNQTYASAVFKPLKELAQLFSSHVYILNVVPDGEALPTPLQAASGIKLDHSLEDIDHSFHHMENDSIVEGINEFVEKNTIDMVVMIPREHSLWSDLFRSSATKQMAFHATRPLLALHE